MTTEFVLIRHGITDWNVEGRMQGISDTELNDTGKQQAQALGDAMRGENWDVIASSPLSRALNTAIPVAEALGFKENDIILDERLMERHYGVGEGVVYADLQIQYPDGVWDGMETPEDLVHRAISTLDDYRERFPDGRIVIVSHGTWINHAIGSLSNGLVGPGITPILNTSRTYVSHDGDGWHVGDVAVVDHLASLV